VGSKLEGQRRRDCSRDELPWWRNGRRTGEWKSGFTNRDIHRYSCYQAGQQQTQSEPRGMERRRGIFRWLFRDIPSGNGERNLVDGDDVDQDSYMTGEGLLVVGMVMLLVIICCASGTVVMALVL